MAGKPRVGEMDKPTRQEIIVDGPVSRAIYAMKSGKSGAERMVLEALAFEMLAGRQIPPGFQRVVNAVILKAVAMGKLPDRPTGRPTSPPGTSQAIALRYWQLRDEGVPYAQAVEAVSSEFAKTERHVMRLAEQQLQWIGRTKEDRDRRREWWALCAQMGADGSSLRRAWESAVNANAESAEETIDRVIRSALDAA